MASIDITSWQLWLSRFCVRFFQRFLLNDFIFLSMRKWYLDSQECYHCAATYLRIKGRCSQLVISNKVLISTFIESLAAAAAATDALLFT